MNLKKIIQKNATVILAFSGGPDSVYLLYHLLNIQKKHPFKIIIAHFNHKLRGRASDKDELFSKKTAKKYRLKFETDNSDIGNYAKKYKLSTEDAARKKRYEFLLKIRAENNADYIITAHHLDDNLETFFLNFTRGSGIKGLKSMDFINGFLLRPLLETTKDEILLYLKAKKLKYRVDKTNKDITFKRNRIRAKIIPELKKIQPNINNLFIRTRSQLAELDEFMDISAKKWIKENNINKEEPFKSQLFEFPTKEFLILHPALKSRIIHKVYEYFHNNIEGISDTLIKRALNLIKSGATGKKIPFGKNTVLTKTSKTFLCLPKKNTSKIKYKKIKIPGITRFEYGEIRASIKDSNTINKKDIINLDYSKLKLPLYIRSKKPGDKIKILGMKGTKKIKDIFIDKKVPSFKRNIIPIFVDNKNEIIAIGENLISDKNKITKETNKILCIKVKHLEKRKKKGKLSVAYKTIDK